MIHLSCLHECRVHYFKIDPVAVAAAAAAAAAADDDDDDVT